MEMLIKTKKYEYDDDVGLLYYNNKQIYKAGEIDLVDNNGYGEPIEEFGFEPDDEFEDMLDLYNKLLDCWDETTKTYKYKKYELRILGL